MNLSKYFILALALFCQQGYAAGKVIFRNNAGVYIIIEAQTLGDGPEAYSKSYPLGKESQQTEKFTNFIVPGSETARELLRQINYMRVKYGSSASASSTMSAYYPIDVNGIKNSIRNCQNGDVIVEIKPQPFFWSPFQTGKNMAPAEIRCREELTEESFTLITPDEAEIGLAQLGLRRTKNPYRILSINTNASEDEINKAWRALTLKWHPDKVPADKHRQATIVIKIINDAREKVKKALNDPAYKRTLLEEE